MRDLFPRASADEKRRAIPADGAPNKKVVATYDYCDEIGRSLFQVVRFDPKDFRLRRRGPDGDWVYNLDGVRRVLYNLAEVSTATHVIVVEGEKDADRVKKALRYFEKKEGVRWAVTTCPGGAKGWRAEYAPYYTCDFLPLFFEGEVYDLSRLSLPSKKWFAGRDCERSCRATVDFPTFGFADITDIPPAGKIPTTNHRCFSSGHRSKHEAIAS